MRCLTPLREIRRGFSLVELVVVIGIIGFITSVILIRYGSFDSEILLNSLAYDVALSVREAQSLSISVRGTGGDFDVGYGVYFTEGNSYFMFRDADDNRRYDPGEEVSNFFIGQDNRIADICVNDDTCDRDALEILFERPEPDAIMRSTPSVGSITSASLLIETPTGLTRTVLVSASGQISVQ